MAIQIGSCKARPGEMTFGWLAMRDDDPLVEPWPEKQ